MRDDDPIEARVLRQFIDFQDQVTPFGEADRRAWDRLIGHRDDLGDVMDNGKHGQNLFDPDHCLIGPVVDDIEGVFANRRDGTAGPDDRYFGLVHMQPLECSFNIYSAAAGVAAAFFFKHPMTSSVLMISPKVR